MSQKYVIFNADDFGASTGINRGVIDCHRTGVVTSASLMVTGGAVEDAVAMSRDYPSLSLGLHWDAWGEDEREFDVGDIPAVRAEFKRQLEAFDTLVGRPPTHIDTHKHAHRDDRARDVFLEMVQPLGVPLRDDGQVRYLGHFYAQWEWMVTDLYHVSLAYLKELLREEVGPGWTEFGCHPGYVSPDFKSAYFTEREEEVRTLRDPAIRQTIDELGIQLVSYADFASIAKV